MPKTVVVVPAYNEAATIADVVLGCRAYLDVIVVNDCSQDNTALKAKAAGATVINNATNLGYEGAIEAGFRAAVDLGADAVITFDADGQHDPKCLPQIEEMIGGGGVDLVIGIRPQSARFGEWLFNCYSRMKLGVPDLLCGLKGYRLAWFKRVGHFDSQQLVGTELAIEIIRRGGRVQTLQVPIYDRKDRPRYSTLWRANVRLVKAIGKVHRLLSSG